MDSVTSNVVQHVSDAPTPLHQLKAVNPESAGVMYSYPPSLQSAPMPSYMSSGSNQASQGSRSSTMPGSVPFRAGDWKCGSEGCGYHNFAKNVSCLRCGASRAQAALIADSTGGLSTPASMTSMSSMYSTPSHHPSDSLGSSIFNSSQFPPSQAYPPPLPSSSNMANQSYPPLGGQSYGGPQGMNNNMGGMGMSGGGGKVGNKQMESGDWTCVSCGYVNFRRRNNCLRCNNFNPNLIAPKHRWNDASPTTNDERSTTATSTPLPTAAATATTTATATATSTTPFHARYFHR